MTRAAAPAHFAGDTPFRDGIGERRTLTDAAGQLRELLCIRGELTAVPAFEFALRERVARLAEFRHPYFATTLGVERVTDVESSLAVLSDRVDGVRLSELFTRAAARGLNIEINAALCLIRQVVPAIARLHETCRDVAHGALAPERVILTANGRLMIADYALGAALEQLRYSQDRYWRDLRVALPHSAGLPRVDQRGDVTQIGIIALSLILSRSLREDEYPARIADVVASAKVIAPRGGFEPLPIALRQWLLRALQVDVRGSFATVAEANDELERVVADLEYPGLPASVDQFLGRYRDAQAPDEFLSEFDLLPIVSGRPGSTPAAGRAESDDEPAAAPDPLAEFLPELSSAPNATEPEPRRSLADDLSHSVEQLFAEAAAVDAVLAPAPAPTMDVAPTPAVLSVPEPPPASTRDETIATREVTAREVTIDVAKVVHLHRLEPRLEEGLRAIDRRLDGTSPETSAPDTTSTERSGCDGDETLAVRGLFAAEEVAPRRNHTWLAIGVVLLVAGSGAAVIWSRGPATLPSPAPAVPGASTSPSALTGVLVVTTTPPGAEAWLDGRAVGATPLTLTLNAGTYSLELRGAGQPKTVPVTIAAGGRLEQFIDLPSAVAPVAPLPGATAGSAPAAAAPNGAATPGNANVAVSPAPTSTSAATATSTPAPTLAPVSAPTGWVDLRAPFAVRAEADGRALSVASNGRLVLPAGAHTLVLTNESLGYRSTRQVDVSVGRTTALVVDVPNGRVALNALPWAEVWIDGRSVGETPIGDLSLPIGTHEVVLRHPELGERRETLTVAVSDVARMSVDLRKP